MSVRFEWMYEPDVYVVGPGYDVHEGYVEEGEWSDESTVGGYAVLLSADEVTVVTAATKEALLDWARRLVEAVEKFEER